MHRFWRGFAGDLLTSRGLSIAGAIVVDIGLVYLLFGQQKYNPPVGDTEAFWVRVLFGFAAYAILQIWTLATVTGRGDDFTAALDKFIALSPLGVVGVSEAYWMGADSIFALSWRHHLVAILWSIFAVTDFFSTDITNQRLRSRQIGFGPNET